MRHSQVRSLDRSERIRTYNFPENRIVDHRTNYKAYNLDAVLDGDLQAVIDSDIQPTNRPSWPIRSDSSVSGFGRRYNARHTLGRSVKPTVRASHLPGQTLTLCDN